MTAILEPAHIRPRPALSPRETDILVHWLRCDSKSEVAARRYLTVSTINTYLASIRAKYEDVGRPAPTMASLLARALQDGLIRLDEL